MRHTLLARRIWHWSRRPRCPEAELLKLHPMLTDEGKRTFDEIWLNVSGNSFGTITKVLQNGSACTVVWDDDPRRQAHTYRTGGLHRFELALVSAHADAEISPNPTPAPPDPVAAIRSSWARTGHDEKEVWKDAGDERVHISHDTDTRRNSTSRASSRPCWPC